FSDDLRLIFAANYSGVHEKKKTVEKIEDAFESPHATVTVMEEVRIESVDEAVAVINDGDGEVKVLNLVQQTIDVESTSNNNDFGSSLPPSKGAHTLIVT
nr:AIG1-like protein [Tanacetum cinerariifolium]